MVEILDTKSNVDLFLKLENITGDFTLKTQYGYQFPPYHPEHKYYFIAFSQSVFNLKEEVPEFQILFDSHVVFHFDKSEPVSVVDLLALVNMANFRMNQLLSNEMVIAGLTNIDLQISPINVDDTIVVLEDLLVNPNN